VKEEIDMDVFELLEADHEKVKGLFAQLAETTDGAAKRETLFKELATELALHTKAEETIVYPRLKELDELRDMVDEGIEEHHEAEQLLAELADMPKDDKQWLAKCKQLQQSVEHHVQEEEDELFPEARELIAEDELTELGTTVQQEKKEMMRGSHGAAKAVFDRLGL
jgi:hemerythrin superfamily protein